MTLPRRLLLLTVIVVVAAGCGKPNPRIAKIFDDKANDDADETFDFTYDDGGRVERVERTEGNDSQLWELTWDGSLLTKVVVTEEEGGNLTEAESELTWENGRLVSSRTTTENDEVDTTYSYDQNGRLSEVKANGDNVDTTTSVNYDAEGRIDTIDGESDDGTQITNNSIELDRDGQNITTFALIQEGDELFAFDFVYDEEKNRVERQETEIETEINGQPTVITAINEFTYDDNGLLTGIEKTAEAENLSADVSEVEVTYDDGDASSLDVTPNFLFLFGVLFDMKGASYAAIDNTTGVPRLAFSSW